MIIKYIMVLIVDCEELKSTDIITVNMASTTVGSNATYQCREVIGSACTRIHVELLSRACHMSNAFAHARHVPF